MKPEVRLLNLLLHVYLVAVTQFEEFAMGYENMSVTGRAMAEMIELLKLQDVLTARRFVIPGYKVPTKLNQEIAKRFAALTFIEQSAVTAIRATNYKNYRTWTGWLASHLEKYPQDTASLYLVAEYFGGSPNSLSPYVMRHYGTHDRPWQMDHQQWCA